MTDNENKVKSLLESAPERYRLLKSGALYDMEAGRIVENPNGGKYAFTRESSLAVWQQRREKFKKSWMRGLADTLPEDATDEEIVEGALDGTEVLVRHMKREFLKSGNIRGLAEAIRALIAPLLGPQVEDDEPARREAMVLRQIFVLARNVEAEVTDGEIVNAGE